IKIKKAEWIMGKITFLGAGSTDFARNVLGASMTVPALQDFEVALYDIGHEGLKDSEIIVNNIKKNLNSSVRIVNYTYRKEALRDAQYVINAIQVGGYERSTDLDYEIAKKCGLR